MALHDDSLMAVVVIPAIGGVLGLLVLGPVGFFAGLVIPLVVGANARNDRDETDERIAELEQRVEELEGTPRE